MEILTPEHIGPLSKLIPRSRPALVLAPMQDVTDLAFMRVIARRGAPDWFVTEYFRVHPFSKPEKHILRSIDENETGKPIFAQMIGNDAAELIRTARELCHHPIAGIDLNLGCPAPIVCRKDAGGGLLRDPQRVDRLLGELRENIPASFTVKTRVGHQSPEEFVGLLDIFRRHGIDGLTIHGRTVAERYQTPVHPDCVKLAVETMPCPVIANGNIVDPETAAGYHQATAAAGLMIGRGAIRNPWLFRQCNERFSGKMIPQATHRDLLEYIVELSGEIAREAPRFEALGHVQRMKKTLAYISHGLDGNFEYEIRRVRTPGEFEETCARYLDHDTPLPARPPADSKLFCGFSELLAKPVAQA